MIRHMYGADGFVLLRCLGLVSAGVNNGCAGDSFFKDWFKVAGAIAAVTEPVEKGFYLGNKVRVR